MAAVGDFAPFTTVLEAALDQVLAKQGLDPSTDKRKALVKQLETLDARSGAREAFSLLIEADIPVIALLNGSRSSTKALLAGVELDDLVEEIVSVDEVKLAKPRTEVYLHAAEKAGIKPEELALVAAHPWDIHGAAKAGLVTAYLAADRLFPRTMRTPDMESQTLPVLARRLAAL